MTWSRTAPLERVPTKKTFARRCHHFNYGVLRFTGSSITTVVLSLGQAYRNTNRAILRWVGGT